MAINNMTLRKADARECVLAEWKAINNSFADRGETMIYASQKTKAVEIMEHFVNGKSLVSLVLPPQWGKTGTALYLMYLMTTYADDDKAINPSNVYVVSGMSDTDWENQTRDRMIPMFRNRVCHRNKLSKMLEHMKTVRDGLIVIDECHIGSALDQTLHKQFKNAGLLDLLFLKDSNIKILMISATPVNVLLDAEQWGKDNHALVISNGTDTVGYMGFHTMLQEKRLRTAKLTKEDDIAGIMKTIRERWTTPRYHIFRISEKMRMQSTLTDVIKAQGYTLSYHDSTQRNDDIDTVLTIQPYRHHFIFIKGFWKASKSLNDKYIGICYEVTTDGTAAAQGLGGRLNGFGKQSGPEAPLLYCNPALIKEYQDWIVKGCDYLKCKRFNSTALKIKDGVVTDIKPSVILAEKIKNLVPVPHRDRDLNDSDMDDNDSDDEVGRNTVLKKVKSMTLTNLDATTLPTDKLITSVPRVMSTKEFMSTYKINNIPSSASELSKHFNKHIKRANISYTAASAQKVASIDNYYKNPDWAGKALHVCKQKATDTFLVIERNTKLLEELRRAPPGQTYYAYNERELVDVYTTVYDI